MKSPARVLVVLAAVAALAVPMAGQSPTQPPAQQPPAQQPPAQQPPAGQPPAQNPQQQPPPRIKTGINYVRVDVIVSDKSGAPVLDLKPEDFALTEDGKPQKIEAFDLVKIDEVAQAETRPPKAIRNDFDEEQEAARPDVRLFVILLDDYHVRRGSDMAVRKPLIDFIQNQLAPADMVALMYPLTPVTDLRFTRDRDSLIAAINKFEGRKFIYEPRNSFEEQYAYYPASVVERVRNQVTMDALKGAAVRMGGLREGRKSIILVSEGFTTILPAQLNDPVAAMPGLGNPNRGNSGAPTATDQQKMLAQTDLFNDMRLVFDTLNRQNTSIYAVDPRGLAVFEYGINESVGMQQDTEGLRATIDTLHVLANNTDGRAIVNRNDLAAGMKQILRDASGYYLLG
ncbi:MAG TPA: VWA domain-containing protein, partial [Vicinamibacterales bacterium]